MTGSARRRPEVAAPGDGGRLRTAPRREGFLAYQRIRLAQVPLLAPSPEQVDHFREHGYLVVEEAVTGPSLGELREVTDRFLERARELDETFAGAPVTKTTDDASLSAAHLG